MRTADETERGKSMKSDNSKRPTRARNRALLTVGGIFVALGVTRIIFAIAENAKGESALPLILGPAVGIPIALLVVLATLYTAKYAGVRRVNKILSVQPHAFTVERVIYSLETDDVVQKLGGLASEKPGYEHLSIGVDASGVYLVRNMGVLVLFVPRGEILDIDVIVSPMLVGKALPCLRLIVDRDDVRHRLSFGVGSDARFTMRSLKEQEVQSLKNDIVRHLELQAN